jgi:hypothetical protein
MTGLIMRYLEPIQASARPTMGPSDVHFLEKREMSYVGCGRARNVAVARPKPVKESIICLILPEDR